MTQEANALSRIAGALERIALALETSDVPMSPGAIALLSELESYTIDSRGRVVAIQVSGRPTGPGEPEL